MLVAIADPDSAPGADPGAGPADVQAVTGRPIAGRRADRRLGDEGTQALGDDGGDLGDQMRALRRSAPSPRCATQSAPSTATSISSGVSMRGGMS